MQLLNVQDDGFLKPLKEVGDAFSSTNVIIVVHEGSKRIFIWKGPKAGVRKKFISARAAQNLRFEDMAYNTIAIDSGEDTKLEQEMMKLVKSGKITLPKPKITPPATSNLKGIAKAKKKSRKAKAEQALPAPPQIPVTGQPPQVPVDAGYASQGPMVIDARPVLQSAKETIPNDVLSELHNMQLPTGYEREAVIIGKSMFTVIETKQTVFGKTIEETELRKMDSPPDGVYLASDTTPRLVIKGSQVLFSEFLKRSSAAVPERVEKDLDLLGKVLAKGIEKTSDKSDLSLGKPISGLFKSKKRKK